jgi:hypothetical protein
MTKKLEDMLNLPEAKAIVEEDTQKEQKKAKQVKKSAAEDMRQIDELDKISSALPAVKGLGEMADKELNEVADKAMTAYDDLMDLGMNVEARYSGRVFEVAGTMLKTGLDAKIAKLDKKLKMVDLQLKKEKMDRDSFSNNDSGFSEGQGVVVTDRNTLLSRLKGEAEDK